MLAEEHRRQDIDDRRAGERAALHGGDHSLLDRRNVLVRDHATLDLVDELESLTARQRLEPQMHLAELAAATRLLLVAVLALRLGLDRLAIRHLRAAQHDLDAEALPHAIDGYFELEGAHAAHQTLLGARLVVAAEGGVFLVETIERLHHLLLVALVLGADALLGDRVREPRRIELHGSRLVGERVPVCVSLSFTAATMSPALAVL